MAINYPVNEYQLYAANDYRANILLRRVPQEDGSDRWIITDGSNVLSRNCGWLWQPLPSSRSEDFLALTRYQSADEALQHWESLPDAIKFETIPDITLR